MARPSKCNRCSNHLYEPPNYKNHKNCPFDQCVCEYCTPIRDKRINNDKIKTELDENINLKKLVKENSIKKSLNKVKESDGPREPKCGICSIFKVDPARIKHHKKRVEGKEKKMCSTQLEYQDRFPHFFELLEEKARINSKTVGNRRERDIIVEEHKRLMRTDIDNPLLRSSMKSKRELPLPKVFWRPWGQLRDPSVGHKAVNRKRRNVGHKSHH